jgi:hypothetical protein
MSRSLDNQRLMSSFKRGQKAIVRIISNVFVILSQSQRHTRNVSFLTFLLELSLASEDFKECLVSFSLTHIRSRIQRNDARFSLINCKKPSTVVHDELLVVRSVLFKILSPFRPDVVKVNFHVLIAVNCCVHAQRTKRVKDFVENRPKWALRIEFQVLITILNVTDI